MKDLTKILQRFVKDLYPHRNDLTIEIRTIYKNRKLFYIIHISVHIDFTDGLLAMINKGIDSTHIRKEILSYFNLDIDDFRVSHEKVYPTTIS
jgi:hypothetical protein